MATREELLALVSDYLLNQRNNDIGWYYSTTPAELETLYKDLLKSQYDIKNTYDTVINKYSVLNQSDPTVQFMFNNFNDISNKTLTADDIIDADKNVGRLSPGQKQDLKTYENEMYAREKFEQETLADQRANAAIYGLPMPDASSYIPPIEMLEGLMPTQKGGMTELATSQRWQRDAQKKYAEALAAYNNLDPSVSRPLAPTIPLVDREDNAFVRPNARIIGVKPEGRVSGEKPEGRVSGEKPEGRVSGSRTSTNKEMDDKKKEALWAKNTASVAKRAAEMRVQQDASFTDRLANEIARQMIEKYGTPYEEAVKRGRELAEEEARNKSNIEPNASGRSTGIKPKGGGGLSEWDKEQNRKRKLIEGRGI